MWFAGATVTSMRGLRAASVRAKISLARASVDLSHDGVAADHEEGPRRVPPSVAPMELTVEGQIRGTGGACS